MSRRNLGVLWGAAVAVGMAGSGFAAQGSSVAFDLPAESLADALRAVGKLTDTNILINRELIGERKVPALKAEMTVEEALDTLLQGTGLVPRFVDEKTVVLAGEREKVGTLLGKVDKKVAEGADRDQSQGGSDGTGESTRLEEIVVTAQKKKERLLDVPSGVSAISGDTLQALHVNDLADLSYYVPGLNVVSGGAPGARTIIMRGLYSGDALTGAPTAATYVNDLPIGTSSGQGIASSFGVDLNPYDVDHVEVLKGPQGTLYGANAVGGLIKYSLKQPNLNVFDASVGSSIETIDGSQSPSWNVRGAVNIPLVTNILGLRVSGFDKRDAGYINNLWTGEKAFNSAREDGGRATMLWTPNDRFSVSASVLAQNVKAASGAFVDYNQATNEPAYGGLVVNSPFLNPLRNYTRIYSLSINWNLEFATLSSTTGWTTFSGDSSVGLANLGVLCFIYNCPDYPQANALTTNDVQSRYSKFVQEVRLASGETQRLQWLVGGFFTHEIPGATFEIPTYTAAAVPLPSRDVLGYTVYGGTYKEAAGFGNITFRITDRVDVGAGGRYSSYTIDSCALEQSGLLFGGNVPPPPCQNLPSTGVALWMANVRYHLTPESMLYARAASGYRPGYGCPTCGPLPGLPGVVKADQSTNYEAGLKGRFFGGRLQLDTDVYHILWRDLQTSCVYNPSLFYPCNAAAATSNGWELTSAYQVVRGLTLTGSVGYTHAYLTKDAVLGTAGKSGDSLPDSLPWSADLRLDYTRPLNEQYSLLLGGNYRYRDSYSAALGGALPVFQAQNLLDLYAGLGIGKALLRIYGTNVFNKVAFQGGKGSGDATFPTAYVPITPRTIGISVDYSFGRQ